MGLSDIRKIVSLMGLTAAGRVELLGGVTDLASDHGQANVSLEFPAANGSEVPTATLTHLSSAIGFLAKSDRSASNLVLHMCTKVFLHL